MKIGRHLIGAVSKLRPIHRASTFHRSDIGWPASAPQKPEHVRSTAASRPTDKKLAPTHASGAWLRQ